MSKDSPSKTELAVLARTDKPTADAIGRAQRAFADLLVRGARIVVTTPPGNGHKPVVTVVPPGFDASRPATVQTHYHGDRTSSTEPGGRATIAMKELMERNPQQVFVLPEAGGNVGASPTDWTNVKNQAATTRDALAAAGVSKVGETTLSVHSAGGRALASALKTKDGVAADRVVLLDCLYEPAMSQIRTGLLKMKDDVREFVVVRGTNERDRAVAMNAALSPRSRLATVPTTGGENPHDGNIRGYLDGRTNLAPDPSGFRETSGWSPS